MTNRLPIPGGDDGTWGAILNSYLGVSHNSDGSLQTAAISSAGGVLSVNNQTPVSGAVTLHAADVGALDQTTADGRYVQVGGDLGGTTSSPTVAKINGVNIGGTPAVGQLLTVTGAATAAWQPAAFVPNSTISQPSGVAGLDSNGLVPANELPLADNYSLGGLISQTFSARFGMGGTPYTLSSGSLRLDQVVLEKGTTIGHIGFAHHVAMTPTGGFYALWDTNLNLLAISANITNAIAVDRIDQQAIATVDTGAATSFTSTYTGRYYVSPVLFFSGTAPGVYIVGYPGGAFTRGDATGGASLAWLASDTFSSLPTFPYQATTVSSPANYVWAGIFS